MLMRRCGYAEYKNRQGVVSFVKRIRGIEFPRFHAYIELATNGFSINLHLDQKAPIYKSVSAHGGEYDGPVVEREGERIRTTVEQYGL